MMLVSCGKQKPMVTDITVAPSYEDNDVIISVDADLSLGNVTLPATSIPILLPKTWQEIGSVQMSVNRQGENNLKVMLNLTAIAKIEAQSATLPNGAILPLIGENKTIVIPVENKLNIYVSFGDGLAALGVAIPFKTLDGLGDKVGTTALFPVFNIKNVFGTAGLYTSRNMGENGIALFADLSQVLDPIHFLDIGAVDSSLKSLQYHGLKPSEGKKRAIDAQMLKLHKTRKRLSLH